MVGSNRREAFGARSSRVLGAVVAVLAMLAASMVMVGIGADTAAARGPAYPGPQTTSESPAYFGPAPNPFPYCDNPTYFDPWEENITPTGRLDVGDTATVTTDGMTMVLEIEDEGDPGGQYPGFFPFDGEGVPNDRAKGFEVAPGDSATVTLSQPLFYAQFIFTDVDQPGEGFEIIPDWAIVGEVIAYGGDGEFTFDGTTNQRIVLDDLDGIGHPSESVNGRAQIDMLGAVNGITFTRPPTRIDPDTGLEIDTQGQSGLSVAGGCEASGAAKRVVSGPTWNGDSFEVTYELRLRNNMPTEQTILDVVAQAQANAQTTFETAPPTSIPLDEMRLQDQLADPAFSQIVVTNQSTTSPDLVLNSNYNGLDDDELLAAGSSLAAESDAVISLTVEYTPDATRAEWVDCATGYDYLNQSEVSGTVGGIAVSDLSDDGVDPTPSSNNGFGDVDDPTPVLFPCLPASLDIVKTAINGPNGVCPTFANGLRGDGPTLPVIVDDVVTYCISVENAGLGTASDVSIADPQAPGAFTIGTLQAGQGQTVSYDVQVDLATPELNTATATGTSALGALGPISDTARISVSPKPQPDVHIVKTVLPGPNATCPDFDAGVPGRGTPLPVDDGDVVTYCISVRNDGPGDALAVVVSDDQAPQNFDIGTLNSTESSTVSYDLTVTLTTPTINVAFADGDGPDGPFDQVSDDAEIDVSPLQPSLAIVKTVVVGPGGECSVFEAGVPGPGVPLVVTDGDTVTYCVSVINNGPGIATNVVVTDAQAPAPFDIGTLASGAEQTVSYDIQVSLQTPDTNTARANGDGPDGELVEVSDDAVIAVERQPEPTLEIVKTAVSGANATCPDFASGTPGRGAVLPFVETDTVTYCLTVRNVGEAPASNVVLSDDQAPNGVDLTVGNLAVNEEVTRSYELVVSLQTPSINVGFADGDGPYGPVTQVSDDAEIAVRLQPEPALEIVKTVVFGPNGTCPVFAAGVPGPGTPLQVTDGDTVTYCVSVLNSGPGVATNVVITDAQAPGPFDVGTLAGGVGQSVSYDVQVSLATPDTNTAMANGDGPTGVLGEVSDDAVIAINRLPEPQLDIVKTAVRGANAVCPDFAGGTPDRGTPVQFVETETVTYCLTVRNIGAGAATNVVLSDDQAPNAFDLTVGDLAVGAEATRSFELVVSLQTETVNIGFADGDGPYGPVRQVNDEAEIIVSLQPDPVLEIVKTVVQGPNGTCPDFVGGVDGDGPPLLVLFDDVVTYCLAVTNSGENDATSVQVSDPQAPGLFSIGVVAVGEEVLRSYDITVTAQTEERNTATVAGIGPNGQLPEDSDSALIDSSPQPDPVVDIVKTAVEGPNGTCPEFDAGVIGDGDALAVFYGDVVTYCISVRNDGERAAQDVMVADAQAPQTYDIGTLDVDAVETVSYDITVDAQTEELNTATVTGTGPNGELPEASDTALIDPSPQPDPQLNIVKTVVLGPDGACPSFDDGITGVGDALRVDLGDIVTYCISVRNTGARNAENVVITDEQAPDSFDIGTLAVGETVDRSYDLVIDIDTPLVNVAVVTGEGPNGELPQDEDDARINTADIELVHTVIRTGRACDDTVEDVDILVVDLEGLDIIWCYRVTNTGNVPLTNIALSSPDIGFSDLDVLENADRSFLISSSGDLVLVDSAPVLPAGASHVFIGSANVEPGAIVLLPGETVSVDVATFLPGGGLISTADVVADPADIDGNLLGLPEVTDVDEAEVREGLIQLDKTVVAGADADCAAAGELVVVPAGDPVTWCFTVTNVGSLDLQVADIVDGTLDVTVPVPDEFRVLEPDVSFTVSASGASPGAIINLASVEGLALDPAGQVIEQAPVVRDEDTAEIRLPQADLAIDKAVSDGGPVPLGTVLTYTLLVSNNGPDAATGVEIDDVLPTGLQYVALPSTSGWACSLDGDQGFVCSKADDMASGESATLIYTVRVELDAQRGVQLENVATVEATTDDPDTTNNTDQETTSTDLPDEEEEVEPRTEQPEYPGPFTTSDPPVDPPEVPDEVLGLAITGSSSRQLGLLSAAMLMLGALLMIGSRRSRDRRPG